MLLNAENSAHNHEIFTDYYILLKYKPLESNDTNTLQTFKNRKNNKKNKFHLHSCMYDTALFQCEFCLNYVVL